MLFVVWKGVIMGCLYSLGALGLVMVYKASRMVNFAHGAIAGLAAFGVYALTSIHGWPWGAAVVAAIIGAAVLSMIVYLVTSPLLKTANTTATIATLGVGLIVQGVILSRFGANIFRLDLPFSGTLAQFAGMSISVYDIAVLITTIVVVVILFGLVDRTNLGISFRAVSTDPVAALVCGLSITRVHLFAWISSSILGVIASLLIVPTTFLSSTTVTTFMLQAFAAAVIGGFDSLPGSALGGILVGITCNLFSFYVAPELLNTFVLVFILFSLSFFPGGILSKRVGSRV